MPATWISSQFLLIGILLGPANSIRTTDSELQRGLLGMGHGGPPEALSIVEFNLCVSTDCVHINQRLVGGTNGYKSECLENQGTFEGVDAAKFMSNRWCTHVFYTNTVQGNLQLFEAASRLGGWDQALVTAVTNSGSMTGALFTAPWQVYPNSDKLEPNSYPYLTFMVDFADSQEVVAAKKAAEAAAAKAENRRAKWVFTTGSNAWSVPIKGIVVQGNQVKFSIGGAEDVQEGYGAHFPIPQ